MSLSEPYVETYTDEYYFENDVFCLSLKFLEFLRVYAKSKQDTSHPLTTKQRPKYSKFKFKNYLETQI